MNKYTIYTEDDEGIIGVTIVDSFKDAKAIAVSNLEARIFEVKQLKASDLDYF